MHVLEVWWQIQTVIVKMTVVDDDVEFGLFKAMPEISLDAFE